MGTKNLYGGDIAIVGGGISGLTLAIALIKRGFKITIYEQASHFHEIGAGVAFHPAAERAMARCDESVLEAFHKVETHNINPAKRREYFQFYDGMQDKPVSETDMLFTSRYEEGGMSAVHRAAFLDELIKLIPEGFCHFKKHLDSITAPKSADGKYTLHFGDGTTVEVDVVIGTDGIKSSVRKFVLGPDHPSIRPVYTHKYAYRGLIPMEKASKELGAEMAQNAKLFMGKDGHVLTFPINKGETMNVVAFHTDKDDWPDHQHLTRPSDKRHMTEDFKEFGSTVKQIIDLLEPQLDCWAIFDTGDVPLQRFSRGRVLVLGDAAHATTPHHGSGAGVCIEDAAILADLLTDSLVAAHGNAGVENAFEAFSAERVLRAHRLIESSRRAGELYEARTELGREFNTINKELHWRYRYLWEGDLNSYIKEARHWLSQLIEK